MEPQKSSYERVGGEERLREIIRVFVERVFADVMIGFHFRNASLERVSEMEFQFAARMLGADIQYEGKPIRNAHAAHPIMGGQFMRRQVILRQTLEEYGVPADIIQAWLDHNESLRPLITGDGGGHCDEALATKRLPKDRD